MSKFVIQGGKPIQGDLYPVGSKNAILPIIAASLLTSDTCILKGVPAISDVRVMIHLMQKLHAQVHMTNKGEEVAISSQNLMSKSIDKDLASKIRASNLFIAPLLIRFGEMRGYYPGGDKIGLRSMEAHFDGIRQSGYFIESTDEEFFIRKDPGFTKKDYEIYLFETSPTATENIIMLNSVGDGSVTIENAACEPQVRDLCIFLKKMGADIQGEGSNRIHIQKVRELHGARHVILRDYLYMMTFVIFSLMTGGELRVHDVVFEDLRPMLTALRYFNAAYDFADAHTLHIPGNQDLKLNEDFNIYTNIGINSDVWPKLPTDILPVMIALATQCSGRFLFFEKLYAGRVGFAKELQKLGAQIEILDDHRVVVSGKTMLHGEQLTGPDVRSSVMYLAAMLAADGRSILDGIEHIERGYPHIENTLVQLGGNIKKI